ncbi:hypothetical protein L3Y34_008291 [Caenorhabditis briggsae]|uniref:Aminopeptidase n=2 Tax=Caenorhabditis briggsae TaxID=6238 RepID=A0AAE9A6E1_CAEBR|nr:hypothetical protein L3Y34_008291 [Caenorhabditis briggsae]
MKKLLLSIFILTTLTNSQNTNETIKYTNFPLPTAIFPVEYDLNITTYLPGYNWKADERNMSYLGSVSIRMEVRQEMDKIVLHSSNLTIIDAKVINSDNNLEIKSWTINDSNQFLILSLNKIVNPGENLEVFITFGGYLREDRKGYYITKSTKPTGEPMINAVTQFEATSARFMVPCFDEPQFKATWQVKLTYPTGAVGLTNTIDMESIEDGDFTSTTYKRTVKMSSYLLAIFVGDVQFKETTTKRGLRIRVYADPKNIESVDMALNASRLAVDGFEELFGIDFPMEKIDFVSVFDFEAGAMENWGLIIHRAELILGTDKEIVEVVIHELAHQWFGNLVTMKYWYQTWLNEGFATFMTAIGQTFIDGNFSQDTFHISQQEEARLKDRYRPLRSVAFDKDGSVTIQSIYYSKGSSFIRMLEKIVGTLNFYEAMRNYLSQNMYSNVKEDYLYSALEAVWKTNTNNETTLSISEFAECWTNQNSYPTVFATRTPEGVVLTQNREAPIEKNYTNYDECGYKWDIPIWYQVAGEGSHELVWFKKDQYELEIRTEKTIIVNAESYGYYDVIYDDVSYQSIARELENNPTLYSMSTKLRLLLDLESNAYTQMIAPHSLVLIANALRNDEFPIVQEYAQTILKTTEFMINRLNEQNNEDLKIIKGFSTNTSKVLRKFYSNPSEQFGDYFKRNFKSDKEFCETLRNERNEEVTNQLVDWLNTNDSSGRKHIMGFLMFCAKNKDKVRGLVFDPSFDWTALEKSRNIQFLKILNRRNIYETREFRKFPSNEEYISRKTIIRIES